MRNNTQRKRKKKKVIKVTKEQIDKALSVQVVFTAEVFARWWEERGKNDFQKYALKTFDLKSIKALDFYG